MKWRFSIDLAMVSMVLSFTHIEAGVYKWVDENGRTHFTDSRANIPKNSKVETQKELGKAPQKKKSSRSEIRNPSSILGGKSPKNTKGKTPNPSAKLSDRQKDILEKMENEILNLRHEFKESETRYKTLEKESIVVSQEASNDIDYSDQHREDRHAMQRKAYDLGEELTKVRAEFFDMREKLKYKEFQLKEFRLSLEKQTGQNIE